MNLSKSVRSFKPNAVSAEHELTPERNFSAKIKFRFGSVLSIQFERPFTARTERLCGHGSATELWRGVKTVYESQRLGSELA